MSRKPFGTDFRIAVGLPALLIAFIMLAWSWDLEAWARLIPLLFFLLAGACLLHGQIARWLKWMFLISAGGLGAWGVIVISTAKDAVASLVGAVIGGIVGVIGGYAGGYLSNLFSPAARLADLSLAHRLMAARKSNQHSSMVLAAFAGLLAGALVGLLGHHANLLQTVAITTLLFMGLSEWLEESAGESIIGLPGTLIGGGLLGVCGGYAGRYITAIFW